MAMLFVVDKLYGDKRLVWRADDEKSKNKAVDEFKDRLKRGWLAFKIDPNKPGNRGTQIKEFDENAEKIVMTPGVGGG
jgi:hypothetical protein